MTSCVEWTGCCNDAGYGVRWFNGKLTYAHRVAYIEQVGPIPEGMTIDHLCRNRACVNVAHMEVVTNRENILRGTSPSARASRQTHCIHGHPFDEENTYIRRTPTGIGRVCRQWQRDRDRRYRVLKTEDGA